MILDRVRSSLRRFRCLAQSIKVQSEGVALLSLGRHNLWLVWRDQDFKDFCLVGGRADGGFVAFLLTGCDRNPWADARGPLNPAPPPMCTESGTGPAPRALDDPN